MALRLTQSPTYRWPIKITIGGDCEPVTFTFKAVFNRLSSSRINQLVEASNAKQRGEEIDPEIDLSDVELLDELMSGWEDVVDEDGNPEPFTPSSLARLAELATAPTQILEQYAASLRGAKAKNSKAPSNTSSAARGIQGQKT